MYRSDRCRGCKRDSQDRLHEKEAQNWNYIDCSKLQTTDSYGILNFPGSLRKRANVNKHFHVVLLKTNFDVISVYKIRG